MAKKQPKLDDKLVILLTNHFIGGQTGTETWIKTMKEALKGHEVDTYSFTQDEIPTKHYDLALINHHTCLKALENTPIETRIFTSHGVIPDLEQPIEGADYYVSVSEEVQDNLKEKGFESTVIRNPIDKDVFKPTNKVNKELKNVLFMSNYPGNAGRIVEQACRGLNFKKIGGGNRVNNPQDYINWADLVITLGRGVLESMSCNRNVIVFDYNGGDGFIDEETFLEYRKKNNSGRTNRIKYTPEELRKEFSKYNPDLELRHLVHSPEEIANKYLEIPQ